MPSNRDERKKVSPLVVVLAVVLVVCLAGGVAGGLYLVNTYSQIKDVQNSQALEPTLPGEMAEGQKNPIDFDSLYEQNNDIYSWVYIPDTTVNYPVCQSDSDDTRYLTQGADKTETELGAIFSQHQFNHLDYQDRVTVLYGHNGFGETMFTDLHKFERSEFFDANDKIYIYAPGHVYTYEVLSAFMADDSHLMAEYNFQSDAGFQRFLYDMQNPSAIGANTRPADVDASSKILVLSTCNTGALEATGRYLVCGVMVDDRQTR